MFCDHTYLDVCLSLIHLSLQGQLVLGGQLPLLPQFGLQMIQFLFQTWDLRTQYTNTYESHVSFAQEIPFALVSIYKKVKGQEPLQYLRCCSWTAALWTIMFEDVLLHPVTPISDILIQSTRWFHIWTFLQFKWPCQRRCNPDTWSMYSSLLLSTGLSLVSTWAVGSSGVWILMGASFVEESCSWCHLSCSLRRCISSSSLSLSPSAVSFSWTLQLSRARSSAVCRRSESISDLWNMHIYAKVLSCDCNETR